MDVLHSARLGRRNAMSVTITDEVLEAAGLSEQELQQDLALLLYQQHRLPMEQACRLAGISPDAFQHRLVDSRASDAPAPSIAQATNAARYRCYPLAINGMFISNVSFDARHIYVRIAAKYEITIPLDRLPCLHQATAEQRGNWELRDMGTCICWPTIDYTLSLTDLIAACSAPARLST
jgi:predicted HTH domain antitoxin